MKLQHILIFLGMMIAPILAKGQSINDAKKWYQEGNYQEAKTVFEDIYSSSPNNADVNYWLGVIYLEEKSYVKARKYLEFASQKKVIDSYIYLGELYSLLYKFEDAEKEFVKYEKARRRNKDDLANLEIKREKSDHLQRLVNRTEDIQIIDSVVVSKLDFLSVYKLSASSGSLIPVNEFFKSELSNNTPLFITERKDKIYYSHIDSVRGNKLYTMEKLLDSYGNEKPLSESVNQQGSQAYPFVLTDGVTIYFSSTGHGSLGGYDIFVTRYNLNANTYLAPNQLNMPFNSPYNDYMMVIDEEKGVGWFASDRFQPEGYVCIYTFIPSSRVIMVDSDDDTYLANRAIISSIRDSWDDAKDYSSLLNLSRQDVSQEINVIRDFEFVINDAITYYSLSDFKHGGARMLFSQSLDLIEKMNNINNELSQNRDLYAGGMQGESLRVTILALENDVRNMQREIESIQLRARNEEVRNIF